MNTLSCLALLAALFAAEAATAAHVGLPLRHGRYAEVDGDCMGAPSAAKSWFGGGFLIQAPHARCELKAAHRVGADSFVVAKRCFESGERDKRFDVVDHVRIISHTEYELTNSFGRFHSRWCRG